MIIKQGNVLHTPIRCIAHQVNCQGVMGGGVARQIKALYPNVYDDYVSYIKDYKELYNKSPLGECFICETNELIDDAHIIMNVFGQDRYGTDRRYTDYNALKDGLMKGIDYLQDLSRSGKCWMGQNFSIAIPYNIGCGLAGGDWKVVKEILENIEAIKDVLFVAYNYNRGR